MAPRAGSGTFGPLLAHGRHDSKGHLMPPLRLASTPVTLRRSRRRSDLTLGPPRLRPEPPGRTSSARPPRSVSRPMGPSTRAPRITPSEARTRGAVARFREERQRAPVAPKTVSERNLRRKERQRKQIERLARDFGPRAAGPSRAQLPSVIGGRPLVGSGSSGRSGSLRRTFSNVPSAQWRGSSRRRFRTGRRRRAAGSPRSSSPRSEVEACWIRRSRGAQGSKRRGWR
jgi:hypothetical protein